MRGRVFTAAEIAYCDSKARPAESYAGRFAAREATIKALGGYRGKRWQDISVGRAPSGAPSITSTRARLKLTTARGSYPAFRTKVRTFILSKEPARLAGVRFLEDPARRRGGAQTKRHCQKTVPNVRERE